MEQDFQPPHPTNKPPDTGESPLELLRPLYTYRFLIVACTIVIGAATTAWTVRQPRIYEADCTIEFDPNPIRPLGSAVEDVADPVSSFWASREFFETQNRILTSRAIAERVVRRLALHEDPDFLGVPQPERSGWRPRTVESAASVLLGRISVAPVLRTRLVSLRVRDQDPERAARLANAVVETYIEKTIEDRLSSTVSALEWLGSQLDDLRGQLSASELALHQFKIEHNVLSVSMEDRQNLVASQIQQFSEALTKARTHRIELSARLARLHAVVDTGAPVEEQSVALSGAPTVTTLREGLRTKLVERSTMAQTLGDQHPQMRSLDAEIETLRAELRSELAGAVRAAEADLAEARTAERGLLDALNEAHAAGLELNLREIEYERLNRERANHEKLYNLVLERSAETDLTRMLRTTFVRVVDHARAPSGAVSPQVPLNVGAGLGAGLALGMLAALLLGRMDRRLKKPEDVQIAGLPVLAALPLIPGPVAPRSARRTDKPTRTPQDIYVHENPRSTVAEAFRALRTNLTFLSPEASLRVLGITSAVPQEGKTTITTNLAIAFAQSGKKVLVVDADLRRPRLHEAFGIKRPATGLSSVLVGASTIEEAVIATDIPRLDLLPSGPVPPNPAELLHQSRFTAMLEEVKARYDLVFLDTPPVAVVTDPAVIAPQVDGMLVVVRIELCTKDAIRAAIRHLGAVGAKTLGAIVNGVKPQSQRYGRGGYGYYYSYTPHDEAASGAPPP